MIQDSGSRCRRLQSVVGAACSSGRGEKRARCGFSSRLACPMLQLCSNPACHAPHCPAISALPPHSDAPHKTVPYPPMPHTIYIGFTNSVYGASMHGTVHVLHTVSFALIEHTHTYIHTLSCPKSDTHYKLLYVSCHRMVVHSVP